MDKRQGCVTSDDLGCILEKGISTNSFSAQSIVMSIVIRWYYKEIVLQSQGK